MTRPCDSNSSREALHAHIMRNFGKLYNEINECEKTIEALDPQIAALETKITELRDRHGTIAFIEKLYKLPRSRASDECEVELAERRIDLLKLYEKRKTAKANIPELFNTQIGLIHKMQQMENTATRPQQNTPAEMASPATPFDTTQQSQNFENKETQNTPTPAPAASQNRTNEEADSSDSDDDTVIRGAIRITAISGSQFSTLAALLSALNK